MPEQNDREPRRRDVPAVTRAVRILRLLGKSDAPIGVNQIARDLGLVPSTCLHILRVLADEGLVAFDPVTKRYSMDIGILPIARSALQKNGFSSIVEPKLTDFSLEFGVTAVAVQLTEPEHMVVTAISRAPLPFRLQVDLGSRFPALVSATGRCFAAFSDLDDAELRRRFDAVKWDAPPAFETWRAEVEEVRSAGYAIDRGAYMRGVTILATPFFGQANRMTHSIVAIGISERIESLGESIVAEQLNAIRDYAASLLVGPGGDDGNKIGDAAKPQAKTSRKAS